MARFELEYLPASASPEALAENGRPREQQLRAMRLVHPDGTPTVTAILLLGREPMQWLPGAYVQILRIEGTSLTDPLIDQHMVAGTVADQIRQVEEIVRLNIARPAAVGGPLRVDAPDYPEEALRQLVRNAVLHRNYEGTAAPVRITWFSDRIEIQNPGGPYGQVTRDHFGEAGVTDYRNPNLAAALRALGFVERFGVGIAIARNRLDANANPPLEFEVEEQHVLAIVRRRP
jgi:ATP-dependent DNA helicase RecG